MCVSFVFLGVARESVIAVICHKRTPTLHVGIGNPAPRIFVGPGVLGFHWPKPFSLHHNQPMGAACRIQDFSKAVQGQLVQGYFLVQTFAFSFCSPWVIPHKTCTKRTNNTTRHNTTQHNSNTQTRSLDQQRKPSRSFFPPRIVFTSDNHHVHGPSNDHDDLRPRCCEAVGIGWHRSPSFTVNNDLCRCSMGRIRCNWFSPLSS